MEHEQKTAIQATTAICPAPTAPRREQHSTGMGVGTIAVGSPCVALLCMLSSERPPMWQRATCVPQLIGCGGESVK